MTYVAAVTFLTDVALFAVAPFGPTPFLHQIAPTWGVLALRAFSDGLFVRLCLAMALREVAVRFALGWTRLVFDASGVPADAALAAWLGP